MPVYTVKQNADLSGVSMSCISMNIDFPESRSVRDPSHIITSKIADARQREENPMRKKCLKAIVQEGHNICTSEWQMLSAILKANTV